VLTSGTNPISMNWSVNDLKNKGLVQKDGGAYVPVNTLVDKHANKKEPLSLNKKIIGATKVEAYGILFDSKLEQYMYALLHNAGVEFEHQKEYELQKSFRYQGKAIRSIKIIVDFYLTGIGMIVDTKGWQTYDGKIKHKMLKSYLKHIDGCEPNIELPRNKEECNTLVNNLFYKK
jgi:hypothetical protein